MHYALVNSNLQRCGMTSANLIHLPLRLYIPTSVLHVAQDITKAAFLRSCPRSYSVTAFAAYRLSSLIKKVVGGNTPGLFLWFCPSCFQEIILCSHDIRVSHTLVKVLIQAQCFFHQTLMAGDYSYSVCKQNGAFHNGIPQV